MNTLPEVFSRSIREHVYKYGLSTLPMWIRCMECILHISYNMDFKISQCKRIIIRRTKNQRDVMIRGEMFYNNNIGAPRTICLKGKKAEMIQPITITKGVDVKPLKLRDLRNLQQKHYGENWKDVPNLEYYKNVINLDEEEIGLLEDSKDEMYNMEENLVKESRRMLH
jgi:hypothetical protein